MPLSDREQRLLDQMERALYDEDPKFATTLRKSTARAFNGRQLFLAVLLFAAGMAAMLGGVATAAVVLGVFGFIVMLAAVMVGMSALRPPKVTTPRTSARRGSAPAADATGASFMGKVEERWRRRRDHE